MRHFALILMAIEYDGAAYRSIAERKRLIERWEKEVGSTPK